MVSRWLVFLILEDVLGERCPFFAQELAAVLLETVIPVKVWHSASWCWDPTLGSLLHGVATNEGFLLAWHYIGSDFVWQANFGW